MIDAYGADGPRVRVTIPVESYEEIIDTLTYGPLALRLVVPRDEVDLVIGELLSSAKLYDDDMRQPGPSGGGLSLGRFVFLSA